MSVLVANVASPMSLLFITFCQRLNPVEKLLPT